ncbi:hypothetical protein O7983_000061 [Mycoplasmopsis felis]|uniref:hypothetical protein n=1 Tax=Mycoplasmopsis felis TaxID=33923 RepID=UPI003A4DEF5C
MDFKTSDFTTEKNKNQVDENLVFVSLVQNQEFLNNLNWFKKNIDQDYSFDIKKISLKPKLKDFSSFKFSDELNEIISSFIDLKISLITPNDIFINDFDLCNQDELNKIKEILDLK